MSQVSSPLSSVSDDCPSVQNSPTTRSKSIPQINSSKLTRSRSVPLHQPKIEENQPLFNEKTLEEPGAENSMLPSSIDNNSIWGVFEPRVIQSIAPSDYEMCTSPQLRIADQPTVSLSDTAERTTEILGVGEPHPKEETSAENVNSSKRPVEETTAPESPPSKRKRRSKQPAESKAPKNKRKLAPEEADFVPGDEPTDHNDFEEAIGIIDPDLGMQNSKGEKAKSKPKRKGGKKPAKKQALEEPAVIESDQKKDPPAPQKGGRGRKQPANVDSADQNFSSEKVLPKKRGRPARQPTGELGLSSEKVSSKKKQKKQKTEVEILNSFLPSNEILSEKRIVKPRIPVIPQATSLLAETRTARKSSPINTTQYGENPDLSTMTRQRSKTADIDTYRLKVTVDRTRDEVTQIQHTLESTIQENTRLIKSIRKRSDNMDRMSRAAICGLEGQNKTLTTKYKSLISIKAHIELDLVNKQAENTHLQNLHRTNEGEWAETRGALEKELELSKLEINAVKAQTSNIFQELFLLRQGEETAQNRILELKAENEKLIGMRAKDQTTISEQEIQLQDARKQLDNFREESQKSLSESRAQLQEAQDQFFRFAEEYLGTGNDLQKMGYAQVLEQLHTRIKEIANPRQTPGKKAESLKTYGEGNFFGFPTHE